VFGIAIDLETAVLASSALLLWVAFVHVLMAAGSRSGELVWSGHQPRRLDPSLRARSFGYAVMLVASAWILLSETNVVGLPSVPERWVQSATFVVAAFLGVATIYQLGWGSRWERFFFAPITLLGGMIAVWLTLN